METTETILGRVRVALEHGGRIDLARYPVAMNLNDGILTLSGDVPAIAQKKHALGAMRAISGVSRVVDRLRVIPVQRLGDGAIRDAVCKWLSRDVDFLNCTIRVRDKGQDEVLRLAGANACGEMEVAVEDGVITLSGTVISLSHKRLAGALAWWSRGCRDVLNELVVEPKEEDNDDELVEALRLILETDPYVHPDRIGVGSRDAVITLQGFVSTNEERNQSELDAWYVHGVRNVINRLEVLP